MNKLENTDSLETCAMNYNWYRIRDGSSICAGSLVPPPALTMNAPAKVIRSSPGFPPELDVEQRGHIVDEMVSEFNRYVVDARIEVNDGELYSNGRHSYRLVYSPVLRSSPVSIAIPKV